MAGKAKAKSAGTTGTPSGRSGRTSSCVSLLRVLSFVVLVSSVLIGALMYARSGSAPLTVTGRLGWTSLEAILPRPVFKEVARAYQTVRDTYRELIGKHGVPELLLPFPPYYALSDIWSTEELAALNKMVQGIGTFPGLTRDQTSLLEHIGEGRPMNPDGSCPHPYLIPNLSRTLCVLATRVDVGVHYLMSGGPTGRKEAMNPLLTRTLSFSKFFITNPLAADKQKQKKEQSADTLNLPALQALFASKQYLDSSKSVCNGLSVLDPFQLGVILQLPGQQLGVHLDVPWFFGANRFHFPQWLLVVMRGSGLWEHRAVRQVQGVAYLHEWDRLPGETAEQFAARNGGDFQYWPDRSTTVPKAHPPVKNSAIVLDGSLIPHGTSMFRPAEAATLPIDRLRRNSTNNLRYVPASSDAAGQRDGARYALEVDGEVVASYATEQVRISLVWRAMCFASEAERARYHSPDQTVNPDIPLDEILTKLKADLKRRGYEAPEDPLELALLLLDVYVDYPWPATMMPFNVCIVPGVVGDAIRRIAC